MKLDDGHAEKGGIWIFFFFFPLTFCFCYQSLKVLVSVFINRLGVEMSIFFFEIMKKDKHLMHIGEEEESQ